MKETKLKGLSTTWAGSEIIYFEITDSTNIQARKLAEQGAVHGTVVVADEQTGGLGRRGRNWESPAIGNLYSTLVLRPDFPPAQASMLTIVMALAVAKALELCDIQNPKIKWPNDVVLNGRKICGILTEMSTDVEHIHYVIIGVGINIGQSEFEENLRASATSLWIETGEKKDKAKILQTILEQFEIVYDEFCRVGDLSTLQREYETRLVNKDREVKVLDPKGEYVAVAKGINKDGELIVTDQSGEEKTVYAGEVSVRGIYGYV